MLLFVCDKCLFSFGLADMGDCVHLLTNGEYCFVLWGWELGDCVVF